VLPLCRYTEYSPSGDYVAVCCSDETVKVFQFKHGKAIRLSSMKGHQHTVIHCAWSPDSERLVSVSADKMLHL
jgi:WD40 repeat protein